MKTLFLWFLMLSGEDECVVEKYGEDAVFAVNYAYSKCEEVMMAGTPKDLKGAIASALEDIDGFDPNVPRSAQITTLFAYIKDRLSQDFTIAQAHEESVNQLWQRIFPAPTDGDRG